MKGEGENVPRFRPSLLPSIRASALASPQDIVIARVGR
jgi:hypothetical protein